MNVATMPQSVDRRLEKFFRSELLRISQQYQREGRPLLAGNPDPKLPTYWRRRDKMKMSKADFESGSCRSPDELANALAEMWRQQGLTELSEIAPQLAKLAGRLKRSQHESDEVSPFVYVMY
jgi:hypothetical protein